MIEPEALIARVPAWRETAVIDCSPLPGGLSNRNYLCSVDGARFVVRIVDEGAVIRGDRATERAALERAAAVGIAPEVIAFFPEGHLITRFIEGEGWSLEAFLQPEVVHRVAPVMRRIHALPPVEGVFSPYRDIEAGLEELRAAAAPLPPRLDVYLEALGEIEALRNRTLAGTLSLCHNDPFYGNFLDDGSVRLLDWEFAGMGDPIFDLAVVSYPWLAGHREVLLESYYGEVRAADLATLDQMIFVRAFWNAVWALGQRASSDIDFDYQGMADELLEAMERFLPDRA